MTPQDRIAELREIIRPSNLRFRGLALTPAQAHVLATLYAAKDHTVSKERCVIASPKRYPDSNAFKMHLCALRKKLKPFGVVIHGSREPRLLWLDRDGATVLSALEERVS